MTGETAHSGGDAPGGLDHLTAGLSPEVRSVFAGLVDSFNESAERLKTAYDALRDKFDQLNTRLEETNRELSRSLEEQERLSNYLTNILDSLTSGVLVVDTDGMVTLFNPGAEDITGKRAPDAVGRHYRAVMGVDVPGELTPLAVLESREAQVNLEKTITAADGRTVPVGYSISPLVNAAGDLLGAVEIFMDLTRIKVLEDELSRMDKLAALGQMSATMAHKIRNPLGGIAGYAGLIEMDVASDAPELRHVRRIIEGVDKIDHIITSVLAYNAVPSPAPRPIDVGERLDEIVAVLKDDLGAAGGPRVRFTISHPAEPVSLEADPDAFSQAVRHLLNNAVEAIDDEGEVDMHVMPGSFTRKPSGRLTVALLERMRHQSRLLTSRRPSCIIVITDSGEGMDPEVMNNLFVPFYTTREHGIGLGLASVKKIVDAHHGEIWIESEPGAGTAAGIVLPSRSTLADARRAASNNREGMAGR